MVSYFFLALLLLLLTLARRRRAWLCRRPGAVRAVGQPARELPPRPGHPPPRGGGGPGAPRPGPGVDVRRPLRPGPIVATFVVSGARHPRQPVRARRLLERASASPSTRTCGSLIAEWQSPNFHDPATLAVFVLPVAVTVAYLAFSRRDVPALELALAGVPAGVDPRRGAVHPLLRHRLVRPGGALLAHRARGAPAPQPDRVAPGGRARGVVPPRAVLPGRHAGRSVPVQRGGLSRAPPRPGLLHLPVERLPRLGGPARSSSTAAPSSTPTTACCRSTWRSTSSPPIPTRSCAPMTWSTSCGSRARRWRSILDHDARWQRGVAFEPGGGLPHGPGAQTAQPGSSELSRSGCPVGGCDQSGGC